ncbi:MAG: PAS domain S-box protein [Candidatus Acidiferrum sp.]|jgi:PAS domain S-box-containing protein
MSSSALSASPRKPPYHPQGANLFQGEHIVYFYRQSDSLLSALSDYVGSALGAGNAAVIIATKAHLHGLQKQLEAMGLDIAEASGQGRYVAHDASELLSKILVNGMPDGERFAETVGKDIARATAALRGARPEIAAFGEMVSLLWKEGKIEAAVRLEQLWNELGKKHFFSLRCAYEISSCCGENNLLPLIRICGEHSAVILEEDDISLRGSEGKIAGRRTEERFRLLVDAVQDYAIFMLDVGGHISSWNTGAERLKGYAASEIMGRHFSVFYPQEEILAGKPQAELETAAREGRLEDEGWRLRKDGSRFWASVIITAVKNETGELIGFGKVTRDFTEKLKTAEALRAEIAERAEAQRKLHDSERSLRQLSLRLLQSQDEERRRIGRDLHDSVGQYLVGLKMKVDSLKSSAARGQRGDTRELADCSQLIEEAISEVRTMSYLLYPPMLEELGLKSAIPWYLDGFAKRSGIKTTFEVSPDFDRIPGDQELALFRVLQESLTNVHRHSGSSTAVIRLMTRDRVVMLEVIDVGKGMQSKNNEDEVHGWKGALGVGLRGMKERMQQLGGSLEISSGEEGTTITAALPLPDAELVERKEGE